VEAAGGALTFAGRLEDRRYDTADRALRSQDVVLRLRVYRTGAESRAELDWKGPTSHEGGYKRREELGAHIVDAGAFDEILHRLGYEVTVAIDREIRQYTLLGATVRFERYPRMDDLVEVEGAPDAIERAIAALGLERGAFTSERLPQFVRRFEARTGQVAALADAELAGTTHFDPANA
jgi:adenylate cyclase class IV